MFYITESERLKKGFIIGFTHKSIDELEAKILYRDLDCPSIELVKKVYLAFPFMNRVIFMDCVCYVLDVDYFDIIKKYNEIKNNILNIPSGNDLIEELALFNLGSDKIYKKYIGMNTRDDVDLRKYILSNIKEETFDLLDYEVGFRKINKRLEKVFEYSKSFEDFALCELQFMNLHLLNAIKGENKDDAIFNARSFQAYGEGVNVRNYHKYLSNEAKLGFIQLYDGQTPDKINEIHFKPFDKPRTLYINYKGSHDDMLPMIFHPTKEFLLRQNTRGLRSICGFLGKKTDGQYIELYQRILG